MRTLLISLAILLALMVGGYFILQSQGMLPAALTVQAAQPAQEPITAPAEPIKANNDVMVDAVVVPIQHAALSMAASGIVAAVLVSEGEQVTAGQVIARIENQGELLSVAQAEARVDSVRARLAELQAGPLPQEITIAQSVLDGAQARLDKLKAGAHPADIAAAQAAVNQAAAQYQSVAAGPTQAELAVAQAELDNAAAVLRQAQSDYNEISWRADAAMLPQSLTLEQATNAHNAAQARYATVSSGADSGQIASANAQVQQARATLDKARSPATVSDLAAAESEVRRAQAELDLRKAGVRAETVKAAEAELKEAELALMQRQVELGHSELRAPFAGVIAELNVKVGEQVTIGQAVVQLADLSRWVLETEDLTEISVVNVAEGASVAITVDALPDRSLTGSVERIKPLGEVKQGDIVYTAVIVLNEKNLPLRWRMTAAATIAVAE